MIVLIFSMFFVSHFQARLGIVIGWLGTLLNHYLLIKGVTYITNTECDLEYKKKLIGRGLFFLILKFFVLVVAMLISVQFVGSAVIIPFINYILMLAILVVSAMEIEK